MKQLNERFSGIWLSYFVLVINTIVNLVTTPIISSWLGQADFGIYRLMVSFAYSFTIINAGTSVVIIRYISKYKALGDTTRINNVVTIGYLITFLQGIIILVCGIVFSTNIHWIMKSGAPHSEMVRASNIFFVSILCLILDNFNATATGINAAYERFIFIQLIRIIRAALKFIVYYFAPFFLRDAIGIVTMDLIMSFILFAITVLYGYYNLGIRVRFIGINKQLAYEMNVFAFSMLLQTIVIQINSNVDTIVLGKLSGGASVAIFAIAATIFSVFGQLSIPNSFYISEATSLYTKGISVRNINDIVIQPARLALILQGWAFCGFIIFGREFISIWMGNGYSQSWHIAMVIMVGMIIPNVQNTYVALLSAMNKRMFRSGVLSFTAIVNIILTIFFVNQYGVIGAAYGTTISIIIGEVIIMNIYYKFLDFDIGGTFIKVFPRITACLAFSTIISRILFTFTNKTLIDIVIVGLLYTCIFVIGLWFYAMNYEEKGLILKNIRILRRGGIDI